ncbi:GTP cyclohydrolase I [Microbacterium sp. cx-55]|uniref:GTP cyclohydrolase I n=1 Tax=unclassified Microbacterium TaxID=2609290 RepID=UPI001CBEAC1B|nr:MULTISPECIES: GTP cyclohydrolase I [unclassified Microbacterium]MBZ4488374.1 GTP cyclohydrolase I [Microbacterium sp. cx-55]MCC4909565.1 GTP cyclohydrolase I [Microbacterium sp. cx-59]UGB35026.1 GTP cyclohydrolase I [Microbacterium sp. cx-55]
MTIATTGTDRARAVAAVRELLLAVGEDADRLGLLRTPERVADLMLDLFSGLGVDPASALGAPVALTENEHPGELVGMTGIPFRSVCEHHLLPFDGTVDVYYAPSRHIAGLSRIATLVDLAARRPQLQERLGQQIADALMAVLQPHGVAVRIEATHGCVAHLEPRAAAARAVTVATVGSIPDATWRLAVRDPAPH